MTQSKNAVGNLINRYKAVLKKCGIINTFGSLAVAGMLVLGGVSGAAAEVEKIAVSDKVTNSETLIEAINGTEDTTITIGTDITVVNDLRGGAGGAGENIARTLTIDGQKHTLTGDSHVGFAVANEGNLTLQDVTMTGFKKDTKYTVSFEVYSNKALGGAIHSDGILATKNVIFSNNSIGSTEKLDNNEDTLSYGGAIAIDCSASYSDTGSTFSENKALGGNGMGGAVSIGMFVGTGTSDNITFTNSVF